MEPGVLAGVFLQMCKSLQQKQDRLFNKGCWGNWTIIVKKWTKTEVSHLIKKKTTENGSQNLCKIIKFSKKTW